MKTLFIFLLLFSLSQARENPFFPYENQKDLVLTNNSIEKFTPLKQTSILLPNSARVLKKVTLEIQNLDGSISKREINVNQGIDWHLPIFISQQFNQGINNQQRKNTINKVKKPQKKARKKKAIVKENETLTQVKQLQLLCKYKFISFYNKDNELIVDSDDFLIRDFLLTNPHRIVLDFKRKAFFSTYKKRFNGKYFKQIVVGNHKGYYRVVITLDGKYSYKLLKTKRTIKIVLS